MNYLLKNAKVFTDGQFVIRDLTVLDGKVFFSAPDLSNSDGSFTVFDFSSKIIVPGFVDVHVHLREPGFCYKETILTGTTAGARAGYSALFSMPNLKPVPDNAKNLKEQTDIIKKDAVIGVYPYGAITVGQKGETLSDLDEMKDAVAFSDDGKGVQTESLMEKAMLKAKSLNKIIVAHCEDESLLFGGYIHDGEYAKQNGHKGICSASEYKQIERDLELVERTGVSYHVCHVSAKESVDLIRKAKEKGLNVTAETAPHYLVLDDSMLVDSGDYKMNPPIRAKADRQALIEGILDGTLEMIATDHAPHSLEEKSNGLKGSLNGIVGLETAFPVLYTYLVEKGILTLEKLIELMSINPAKRFGLECGIYDGAPANVAVFDIENEYFIDAEKFKSKGRATPFKGYKVKGECVANFYNGNLVWKKD